MLKEVFVKPLVFSVFAARSRFMFGIITDDDQVKNNPAAQFIWKRADLIGFGAELAKKRFKSLVN